ncbi:MAG: CtsR family transcriptional regulator [Clostridia bacterium]|nr:CtsR family transcriptional regulator [Clostridia bacterium]
MKLSDLITDEILRMLNESEQQTAEIQRNEFANSLGCAPSQINYVLSSRFTPEHGYIIDSRRGGGGYIRIKRVVMNHSSAIMHIINSIGDSIDALSTRVLLENCVETGLVEKDMAKVMLSAVNSNVMRRVMPESQNLLRAAILKEMFLVLL